MEYILYERHLILDLQEYTLKEKEEQLKGIQDKEALWALSTEIE